LTQSGKVRAAGGKEVSAYDPLHLVCIRPAVEALADEGRQSTG
jgi:hypothetical protein